MKQCRLFCMIAALAAFIAVAATAQTKKKTAAPKSTSAPIAAWVNFNGGEDIRSIAHDDKNVYIAMLYTKRMVIIDKATGNLSQISHDNDIWDVVVANNKCYYSVTDEGVFLYDPATGESSGPLFDLPADKIGRNRKMTASPNGNYLLCDGFIIDLREGNTVGWADGMETAVNNIGGAYLSHPEPNYIPLDEDEYVISGKAVVNCIYPDAVTGNTFWCCEQGVGVTEMVPAPNSGIKRIRIPGIDDPYMIPKHISRDDEGKFIITTNRGILFCGKTLDEEATFVESLKTGVKSEYGRELTLNYFPGLAEPDGMGNIIFGDTNYACICIYNPKGLKGYTTLKGKAVRF